MGETGLGPGLILRALVDHLAIIHVKLVQVGDPSSGDGGDMQVLDAMQVGQCKGKSFSLFGCNELIDVDRVNRLLTFPVATTVAKGLPTSGETGKKDVRHHCHSSSTTCRSIPVPIRDERSGGTLPLQGLSCSLRARCGKRPC
jgi:hypothetical protein